MKSYATLLFLAGLLAAGWLAGTGCQPPAEPGKPGVGGASTQPATGPDLANLPALPPRPAGPRGEKIVEADALMIDAITGLRRLQSAGGHGDPELARQVLGTLVRLIREYPQSDQVDDAFFYAGEVLREKLDESPSAAESAAEFYRRAYQADPFTPHPARFQRAALLDFRLNKPAEALAEYREVLRYEARLEANWANSNAAFAAARIKALSAK